MTVNLTQQEADRLLKLDKYFLGDERFTFPLPGGRLCIPLHSIDRREDFTFDVSRGKISLAKNKFQTRARKAVVLARLDLGGAPHRNPDDEEIDCPHLHLYREGYGDRWAVPLPPEFHGREDVLNIMETFLDYCRVIDKPTIDRGVFT